MKTIFLFGIVGTLVMYFIVSMHNHTWDVMKYSQDSVYWFGAGIIVSFIMGLLVRATELDTNQKFL